MRGNPSAQLLRLQNTANPTRSAQRSSRRGGWYLVRSVSSASYAGSVRHSLRPHFLWRRFPQFTSGGLYHKIWRRKKRSRRREKEITLRITSYYCKQQSRALKGQGASHHSHVFFTGAHEHAHKELSLTCTHLR